VEVACLQLPTMLFARSINISGSQDLKE